MKKGSLQSKKRSLEAKQSKNSTHMRGRACICMLQQAQSTPKQLYNAKAWQLNSSFPRICVRIHAYAWVAIKLTFLVTFTQAQT
ncbi:hypothetical protein PIB30_076249, partial [Stylosanthes scabra]|nr:hypothetical protein [Stylosanthes scabra]